jgi:regulator of RNase E activity RraA/2-keto-4-pentenoate hydratase/2-oxohepta-3-ene-1,7-dioic acid hydratase in catechol pathway
MMTWMTRTAAPPLRALPSKIIAVHLNYRSRALERGRIPDFPSYFLKPPSSLTGGGPIVRPAGCELLTFEGEIALVIGRRARGVTPEDAWSYVSDITAANDFGVYDLQYADRGSNLRSKGSDGFTPIGPALLQSAQFDPAQLEIRAYVNGDLKQQALVADELIFNFAQIVADIARTITLEVGDVILTGTPTGSTVVADGDVVEIEVLAGSQTTGRLCSTVTQATSPLAGYGAMPKMDPVARSAAYGANTRPDLPFASNDLDKLTSCSTATISHQLRKRGLDGVVMEGLTPVRPGTKMVGTARTLRFLPHREDRFADRGTGMNAQKRAIESLHSGDVLVIGARSEHGAGTIGDILALRAQKLGATGIVTDGSVRDVSALRSLGLPVFCGAASPAVLGRRHVPWDTDVAVSCAGVLVEPGDVLVGDEDGVVLVPPRLVSEVARDAFEQEEEERFITAQVAAGESIEGLYPLGPSWRQAYEAWQVSDGAAATPSEDNNASNLEGVQGGVKGDEHHAD